MNLFSTLRESVCEALDALTASGHLPVGLVWDRVTCEPPREEKFGDMATNAAMVLAKEAKMQPLALAQLIATELETKEMVSSCSVVAPGFVNIILNPDVWQEHLRVILDAKTSYGDSHLGTGHHLNIEFVSANPTGPLHAGHARVAVVGDVLANLLKKVGFQVTKEYYVNDAGNQIQVLARSLFWRYSQIFGQMETPLWDEVYPGEYLVPVAEKLAQQEGNQWIDLPEDAWRAHFSEVAVDAMIALIQDDLAVAGICQDIFFSEKSLVESGRVDQTIEMLAEKGLVYTGVLEPPKGMVPEDWEPRPQLLFRATAFGDDVDRPLRKSDGSWTYFASDIAYHLDKWQRCEGALVNVWGADHSGYIKRTQAAVAAVTDGKAQLQVLICQMVNLLDKGEAIRMSKRAGNFVTLQDIVKAVGKDVLRFIMLTRKSDQTLDFDFTKVLEQSKDNPVFYVQYAHARACSVMRQADKLVPHLGKHLAEADLSVLNDEAELRVLKKLAEWPRMVELSARLHEPHRLAFYLYDLAATFHILWNRGKDEASLRFIMPDHLALTHGRLALVEAVRCVLASAFQIFGVNAVEEMH